MADHRQFSGVDDLSHIRSSGSGWIVLGSLLLLLALFISIMV